EVAAPGWGESDFALARAGGGNESNGARGDHGAPAARPQPYPPVPAHAPVEPVAPLLAGLPRAQELLQRGPRIGQVFHDDEAALGRASLVGDDETIGHRFPGRAEPGQEATDAQARSKTEASKGRDDDDGQQQRENLIGDGTAGVETDHGRPGKAAQDEEAGRREASAPALLQRAEGAEAP